MGQVNLPTNVLDQIRQLRQQFAEFRKNVGLSSAILRGGGVSLLEGAFLKMVDANDVLRLFIGGSVSTPMPDGTPQPVFIVNDGNGQNRFMILDPFPDLDGYVPVVWIKDHLDNIVMTSDRNGGMAEPWISVPMYPRAWPDAFLDSSGTNLTLPVSACNGSTVWEGRIGKVSHPRIQYDVVAGRVTGVSGSPTYTFVVNGTTLDTFATTGYGSNLRGPFDITSMLGGTNVSVQLKVSATGTSTDRIATDMNGVWLRQS
ncbi:hypothetical protein [Saccharothrix sp. HUAS TT1]|uniref:hypothetical protein n=1 Tax=unclassified Saccharothrix TaxID=2593673 RepID=UPI00345C4699